MVVDLFPEAADRVEIALTIAALTFHFGTSERLIPSVFSRNTCCRSLVVLIETLSKKLQLPWSKIIETSLQDVVVLLVGVHLQPNARNITFTALKVLQATKFRYTAIKTIHHNKMILMISLRFQINVLRYSKINIRFSSLAVTISVVINIQLDEFVYSSISGYIRIPTHYAFPLILKWNTTGSPRTYLFL